MLEGDESRFMPNGQGEQIDIGELPRTLDSRLVNRFRVQHADAVWPDSWTSSLQAGLISIVSAPIQTPVEEDVKPMRFDRGQSS
jgi:hypothetical protein